MKKIILFLLFGVLTLNNIGANESKILNSTHKQTQITKTILPNLLNYNYNNWIKKDSVDVIFDFIKNNKIVVTDDNYKTVYEVKSKKLLQFDIANQYNIKAIDSKKNKHNIQIIYYINHTLLIIENDSSIERYVFTKNLDKKSDYNL